MPRSNGVEIHVNLKALVILAAVAVPLLLADVFFVLDQSRAALDSTVGDHLRAVAEVTAAQVSRFVHSKIVEAGVLAAEPELRRAAEAANQGYRGLGEEAIRQKLEEMDRNWESPKASVAAAQLLASPASAYLRDYLTINLGFKRLALTDAQGAVVAASHKPIDYYQADEDWWRAAFRDGAGAIHVGDVRYDPVSRTHFVSIDLPVLNSGRNQAIGVLRAIIDVGEIRSITTQVQLGAKGEALLVKGDGTIISSPSVTLVMKQKAEEMEVVASVAAEQSSGYLTAAMKGGAHKFIAFADPGLSQAFPELNWKVLVTQDLQVARAPIARVTNRAMATVFGGLIVFGLAAAYFSLHRPQKFTDIEETGK